MSTVERLAFSLSAEGHGIHALLWDDIGELFRVLLVTNAALGNASMRPMLISGEEQRLADLKNLIQGRVTDQIQREEIVGKEDPSPPIHPLWILFLQQAVSKHVGPRLNGWRRSLSEPKGTLLVIRNADFIDFQRNAPDLASFIGPRIYDTARMLMICSSETLLNLKKTLPDPFPSILSQLPGTPPTVEEIKDWSPLSSDES